MAAGATLDELLKWERGHYPRSFMARVIAWHRGHVQVKQHTDDAVSKVMKSRMKNK